MAKAKREKKEKKVVMKPYNSGTMTTSAFWTFIRSALRQKSIYWKPIRQCKINSRRPYKGINKQQKYEYQCNECKNWYAEKNINVDHIIPAGTLKCANDLPGFVERLFVEIEGLQCLCTICHNKKTKKNKNDL
jgi:5-methylcytosine-specific restriction endonuclease McrA